MLLLELELLESSPPGVLDLELNLRANIGDTDGILGGCVLFEPLLWIDCV